MKPQIVSLDRFNIDSYKFSKELKELARKVKGSTKSRPVIITIQVDNTRWVWNSEEPLP